MKLTENLKTKIDSVKSEEEVKNIPGDVKDEVAEADGVILEDEELDKVAGGKAL
jgi:hypothetical protein